MSTTTHLDGAPVWIDLSTPDLGAAQRFYTELFGWSFDQGGPEVGGYGTFQHPDGVVAGGMTVTPEQGPPSWNLYFQTPDLDASARSVAEHGGTVALAPMDVMDLGRMAVFADPGRSSFCAWQPGAHKGFEAERADNALCWAELYTEDPSAATAFYGEVFGWGTAIQPYEGGDYVMVHPVGDAEDMFAGVVPLADDPEQPKPGPRWLLYFAVPDCDTTAQRAGDLGGTVPLPPFDIPGVGRAARLTDPHGAAFAVITPLPQQG